MGQARPIHPAQGSWLRDLIAADDLAATVWVGGQLTLAALARCCAAEVPRGGFGELAAISALAALFLGVLLAG
jgi:hypothetical protein